MIILFFLSTEQVTRQFSLGWNSVHISQYSSNLLPGLRVGLFLRARSLVSEVQELDEEDEDAEEELGFSGSERGLNGRIAEKG